MQVPYVVKFRLSYIVWTTLKWYSELKMLHILIPEDDTMPNSWSLEPNKEEQAEHHQEQEDTLVDG